jgi:thiol-disulfide isomerase/thioredoxin
MQSALRYLGQLDAMPASSITAQFAGHRIAGEAYYQAGDNAKVIAHLTHAFSLLPRIPFLQREWLTYGFSFLVLADVLSGMPDGRRRIDSLTTWMRPFTLASPEQLASDSTLKWTEAFYKYQFEQLVTITHLLGRPAPPIRAHYWINTEEPSTKDSVFTGAEMKTLADGKIRVIEYGHYGCPGCIAALPKMEQLKQTLPKSVEIWMSSDEGDVWGATPCTPQEMVQHLTDFYVTKKKYTLPIAIWIGPRTSDVDGGTLMEESPTSKLFQFYSYPTFAVIDGHGIIRRMVSPYSEAALMRTIQYLLAEQGHADPTTQRSSSP